MANKFPGVAGTNPLGFVPELWAPDFVMDARDKSISHMITNNKFESMLKKHGDTVHFSKPGDIEIRRWKKGDTIISQDIDSEDFELTIDRGGYWSFRTHDIDDVQVINKNYDTTYKDKASDKMGTELDVETFTEMGEVAHIKNTYGANQYPFGNPGSALTITKENAVKLIVNMATAMDETPWDKSSPRWAVAPVWFFNALTQGELRRMDVIGGGGISPIKAGIHQLYHAALQNITFIPSNLLPRLGVGTTAPQQILFGTKRAFAVAFQLNRMRIKEGDHRETPVRYHQAFWVYGMKAIHEKELGRAVITPGADLFAMT